MDEEIIQKGQQHFTWVDYMVFSVMLLLSSTIGVYYAFKDKKTSEQFLMAGKSMTPFPVAMSLVASFISAIGLLGIPSEVYSNGSMFMWSGLSFLLVTPSVAFLYLPVFWELQITSAYEYLERRFHVSIRLIGSSIFIIQTLIYMSIVIYAPSLALTQVTGLSQLMSVSLICFVCMFYTTIGGMKAVMWTDTLQVIIMLISSMVVYIKGIIDVGGFSTLWQINSKYDRIEFFTFDLNPTVRHTVWSVFIGSYFQWVVTYGCNQTQIQRYLCLKEKKMVYKALLGNMIGMILVLSISSFGGLIIFTRYFKCDPISAEFIKKSDQILPYFVMDILGHWRGIPGLFVAGVFSGSLSTLSSGINSLAAITLEDFIKRGCFPHMSDWTATVTSMILSVCYGLITYGLVFVVADLGDNVVSLSMSVFGMVSGPFLGVFSLGMFFPRANSIGAGIGTLSALALNFWIGFGKQIASAHGLLLTPRRPFEDGGCGNFTSNSNDTKTGNDDGVAYNDDDVLSLYKISYLWYCPIGCCTCIIIGLLVSLATKPPNPDTFDPKTISPVIRYIQNLLPWKKSNNKRSDQLQMQNRQIDKGNLNDAYRP